MFKWIFKRRFLWDSTLIAYFVLLLSIMGLILYWSYEHVGLTTLLHSEVFANLVVVFIIILYLGVSYKLEKNKYKRKNR